MNIALLTQLRSQAGVFLNPDSLGLDPGTVVADVAALTAFGFAIECHPYLGYAYRGPASRLCPDQIEWDLKPRTIGRRVAVWNRVSSTNDLAARAASSLANEGLVILAEEQTAGRGSRGRSWSSPPGSSILMSVLLFPPPPLDDPAWLTALAALAVAEVSGPSSRIKWPNDVRVDGRKLAGILVERGQGTVIGIGLNVNIDREAFPESLRDSATSLSRVFGHSLDRSEIARSLILALDGLYTLAFEAGPDRLNAEYGRRSEHLGQDVEVATPTGIVSGRLVELDLKEGLTLDLGRGMTRRVPVREVLTLGNRQKIGGPSKKDG